MKKTIILLFIISMSVGILVSCQVFTGKETNIPEPTNLPGLDEIGQHNSITTSIDVANTSRSEAPTESTQTSISNTTEKPETTSSVTTVVSSSRFDQTTVTEQTYEHIHLVIEEWKIALNTHYKLCALCHDVVIEGMHEWNFVSTVQKGDSTQPSIQRFGCKVCHHTKLVQINNDGTTVDLPDIPAN